MRVGPAVAVIPVLTPLKYLFNNLFEFCHLYAEVSPLTLKILHSWLLVETTYAKSGSFIAKEAILPISEAVEVFPLSGSPWEFEKRVALLRLSFLAYLFISRMKACVASSGKVG